jgi:hypothetical protein
MTWSEKQTVLNRIGFYFETEDEFDNFMDWECEYHDELRINKAFCNSTYLTTNKNKAIWNEVNL